MTEKTQKIAKVAVAIASLGRPETLARAVACLRNQSRRPDLIILSVTSDADLPDRATLSDVTILVGSKGLPRQRNRILNALPADMDLVVFLDDDFVPSRFLIERAAALFAEHPDVVGATGALIDDGINTRGISLEEASAQVEKYDAQAPRAARIERDLYGLYGCNMVFRCAMIGTIRFDERLRLYGWQEDIDFSAQLRGRGRLVKTNAFAGVHQGVKHGRTPGLRIGYSQVINPAYLARKGTMRVTYAIKLVAKNVISNHVRSLRPEPWVDRLGRTKGNWLGFRDLLRGRLEPERIESI